MSPFKGKLRPRSQSSSRSFVHENIDKKIKDFVSEEDSDIQQNLSFIEQKKQRAFARKNSWSLLLSDTAKKFTTRCLSVQSNREQKELERKTSTLARHVDTKKKII